MRLSWKLGIWRVSSERIRQRSSEHSDSVLAASILSRQAQAQIDAQGYAVPYQAQGREVVKVGVEFDKETRNLGRWLIG